MFKSELVTFELIFSERRTYSGSRTDALFPSVFRPSFPYSVTAPWGVTGKKRGEENESLESRGCVGCI